MRYFDDIQLVREAIGALGNLTYDEGNFAMMKNLVRPTIPSIYLPPLTLPSFILLILHQKGDELLLQAVERYTSASFIQQNAFFQLNRYLAEDEWRDEHWERMLSGSF